MASSNLLLPNVLPYDRLKKFHQATSFTDDVHDIDNTQGRAVLINGDVFYSPNCSRANICPPSVSPNPGLTISSLEQPLWWSMDYVHHAFLPLRGQGIHPLESFLPAPTRFVRSRGQFLLDPAVILGWNRLQFELKWIIRILAQRSRIPPFPSAIESALVKSNRHRDHRVLRQEVAEGKGWFMYWVAQLAYVIAVNVSIDSGPVNPNYALPTEEEDTTAFDWSHLLYNAVPKWFKSLGNLNWPQNLLCVIQNCVARYEPNSRVGIFLNIVKPERNQFSVDWFMKFFVPVWYPWGTSGHYATQGTPWNVFRRWNTRRRLERERQPPTSGTRVFEWEKDDDDVYRRVEVQKAERSEVLEDYGKNQKVYNAILNEWDCIRELGDLVQEEIDRMDWGEDSILYDPPTDTQPWVAFFAKWDKANVNMERCESHNDKCARLHREQHHPTVFARVFEWVKDDRGMYQRLEVPKADRCDVLHYYGKNQKVYNAHINEWDCIGELGQLEQQDIEQMDWVDESDLYEPASYDLPPHPGPSTSIRHGHGAQQHIDRRGLPYRDPPPHPGPSNSNHHRHVEQYQDVYDPAAYVQSEYYQPPVDQTAKRSESSLVPEHMLFKTSVDVSEVSTILHEHFGYVPPLGKGPTSKNAPTQQERLFTVRAIGLKVVDNKYFDSEMGVHAVEFVRSLLSDDRKPELDYWDLKAGNRWALGTCRRLRSLRILGNRFLFDFGDAASVTWTLCVDQPEIALFICRLEERLDEVAIVKVLLGCGIPFRTLALLPSHPVAFPRTVMVSVRLPGYVFTTDDYISYRNQRNDLLRDPRVLRAAIMSGGIAWRLALSKGFDVVVEGPTADLIDEHVGICISTDRPGWQYWDDACSTRELDLLCGAYICYNGRKSPQFVVKSWWPLVSTWNANVYHPWWTPRIDGIFQDRLKEINDGNAQPLSQKEWRNIIRGNSSVKKLFKNIRSASHEFLNTAAGGTFSGFI
ncbi:hypothetical protein M413DRAFT_23013 [Hebeloma cylindrosporum]|uniref:Uncharacterized protein n=1 Tax=Hebeloma cylindrosporum TaxID=76867 RepID=A0A0C2Z0C1_HEBCY|nr:hypothetical protein M413DRAFT_23013 [Hebeloma cylindrosporum h7]